MNQEVLLYFRTVADEDNDDNNGAQTSCCFPASRLRAMNPTADDALTLYFDSMKNTEERTIKLMKLLSLILLL